MTAPKTICRSIPAELLDAIYEAEGWKRAPGEVRIRRANALYDIKRDNRRNVYVATRRAV